jgi:hypothetical protein
MGFEKEMKNYWNFKERNLLDENPHLTLLMILTKNSNDIDKK